MFVLFSLYREKKVGNNEANFGGLEESRNKPTHDWCLEDSDVNHQSISDLSKYCEGYSFSKWDPTFRLQSSKAGAEDTCYPVQFVEWLMIILRDSPTSYPGILGNSYMYLRYQALESS
jgi:hypothetical protein